MNQVEVVDSCFNYDFILLVVNDEIINLLFLILREGDLKIFGLVQFACFYLSPVLFGQISSEVQCFCQRERHLVKRSHDILVLVL